MRYLILLLLLCGCYSEKKARQQFDKAATSFPKIPAEFCADEFPVKDSTVRDTLLTTDTVYLEQIADTVMFQDFDTVRITITKTLPAKIITNTIHIRDTIFQTNTAALELCNIDKSLLINLTTEQAADIKKYKGQARKRGWMSIGLIALIIAYICVRVYLKTKTVLNAN